MWIKMIFGAVGVWQEVTVIPRVKKGLYEQLTHLIFDARIVLFSECNYRTDYAFHAFHGHHNHIWMMLHLFSLQSQVGLAVWTRPGSKSGERVIPVHSTETAQEELKFW